MGFYFHCQILDRFLALIIVSTTLYDSITLFVSTTLYSSITLFYLPPYIVVLV